MTVPVDEDPPVAEVGLSESEATVGAVTVNVAVLLAEFKVPVIVALVLDETAVVATLNVPVVAPAATVTEEGTVAEAELLLNVTVKPPTGATDVTVAVPVDETPPKTLVGESEIELRTGGLIVNVAVFDTLPAVAATVATV